MASSAVSLSHVRRIGAVVPLAKYSCGFLSLIRGHHDLLEDIRSLSLFKSAALFHDWLYCSIYFNLFHHEKNNKLICQYVKMIMALHFTIFLDCARLKRQSAGNSCAGQGDGRVIYNARE
jgi:hypothetical protein